ncbi:TniQ family protein [Shewanella sp. MF05960]|uniref:TniQ family protein n=1 Tax=Shewanella sp. MF05960 TaxID=3434874 RepID=UPI003D7AA7CA
MAFLFSPKSRAFNDESLESYLLRVVAENFFDSYEQLSLAIREELHELDFEAHGAFPVDLKRLNVYHAKHNSHFRMRALGLLESLLGLPQFELQKLALLKSDRTVIGLSAVHKNGVDIPLRFIRYNSTIGVGAIPICPHCLSDEPYIRQIWHLTPIKACAKHKCQLLHECPECSIPINYIENESISHCVCGFDFRTATHGDCSQSDLDIATKLMSSKDDANPLFKSVSVSHRMASLVWYQARYDKDDDFNLAKSVAYFESWPGNIIEELNQLTHGAENKLIDLFNRTPVRFIYGELISSLPSIYRGDQETHFIRVAILDYLSRLVAAHPKSKKPNVADMLVSISEAAVILGTTHEQIYRLFQDGVLSSSFRHKMKYRIDPQAAIFYLRQVVEYKNSFGSTDQRMYVSAW